MKAFQVHLNGRKLCTAGFRERDVVLSAIIDHVSVLGWSRTSFARAKWRSCSSAGRSVVEKSLTPPTLSETPDFASQNGLKATRIAWHPLVKSMSSVRNQCM